ncbi:hypothetical protein BCV72DRAFT_326779, partial [Rhizopus microsporus var. microsporus]
IVDILLEDIIKLPERYQEYITGLKQERYTVFGYCPKSKTAYDQKAIVKSLQSMIVGLQKRSLAEHIFVSVSCNSRTSVHRRDLKKSMIMNELSGVTSDVQDLINDLAKVDKARLVVIDSAGLITNMSDLELFIRYVTYYFLNKTMN